MTDLEASRASTSGASSTPPPWLLGPDSSRWNDERRPPPPLPPEKGEEPRAAEGRSLAGELVAECEWRRCSSSERSGRSPLLSAAHRGVGGRGGRRVMGEPWTGFHTEQCTGERAMFPFSLTMRQPSWQRSHGGRRTTALHGGR